MYISGAFLLGTALCGTAAYGTWIYTKWRMGVKDGKEYAEKMREITPSVKDNVAESFVGRTVCRMFRYPLRLHLLQLAHSPATCALTCNLSTHLQLAHSPAT
jgi:hypothetical protein